MKKMDISQLPELLEFAAVSFRKLINRDLNINNVKPDPVELARAEYARRERRSIMFEEGLFFDPCWDMLIGLFIAEADQRSVYITALVDISRVPTTTAMRYISSLEQKGYVLRAQSGVDRRRVRVMLSQSGHDILKRYFQDEHH